jgi:N-acetylmuramic acid 6-phosphate (MurNAc-6-P) etherase
MAQRNPRSQRSKKQFDNYMKDVSVYNSKVDRGRSIRSVDPEQEAFSDDAETLRQTNAIDRANAYDRMMRRR